MGKLVYIERDYFWYAKAWGDAGDAVLNGTAPRPVLNHPIVLTPDGLISSASKLQQLAETESLPEVIVASQVRGYGQEIGEVTVCSIHWEGWLTIREKADLSPTVPDFVVIFEGEPRCAWTVTSLEEGVTLGDEKDGNSVGGSRREVVTGSLEPAGPKAGRDGEPVTEE